MIDDDLYLASQAVLLKSYRKEKGLSQAEVATLTGVSRTAIAMLESAKRGKKSNALITLLQFYEVSIKSFSKRVTESVELTKSTSPYEEELGEGSDDWIEHEWMRLKAHKRKQKKETINNFSIRKHIVKNYGREALYEANKLVDVFYDIHFKNLRINKARHSKNKLKAFSPKNSLFLGKLTLQSLKKQMNKNYALRDSTDRYFKKLPKLFYFFMYKNFERYKRTEELDLFKDTISVISSLVEQNPKVFSSQLLLSNEMASFNKNGIADLDQALYEYTKDSITEMRKYVSKYPEAYRDNFRKILEADVKK